MIDPNITAILDEFGVTEWVLYEDKQPDMSLPYHESKVGVMIIETPAPEPKGLAHRLSHLHPAWRAEWRPLRGQG